jgi:hypothetical protein
VLSDEILLEHDKLEKKATPRPWFSLVKKIGAYKKMIFWSRIPNKEVAFDSEPDVKYITYLRNNAPDFVAEIFRLREMVAKLELRQVKMQDYTQELTEEIESLRVVRNLNKD